MERTDLRKTIVFLTLIYVGIRIIDINEYYSRLTEMDDFIAFILFCFVLVIYYWSTNPFTLSLKDVKRYGEFHMLEYKIITSYFSDYRCMKHMYVKSYNDTIWKELDYALTIPQGCSVDEAIAFTHRNTNGKKLTETMNKKAEIRFNMDNSELNHSSVNQISVLLVCFIVVYLFGYLLYKNLI